MNTEQKIEAALRAATAQTFQLLREFKSNHKAAPEPEKHIYMDGIKEVEAALYFLSAADALLCAHPEREDMSATERGLAALAVLASIGRRP